MALTILLSLVLVSVLQVFTEGTKGSDEYEKTIDSLKAGNFTWKIDNDVTLELMYEALDQCMLKSPEMCLDMEYKGNKCVHLCLKKEAAGSINLTRKDKPNCETSSSQPMQIFVNNQFINVAQQKICLPSSTAQDINKVMIKFKCVQNTFSLCAGEDNSTYFTLYQEAKSWIEAMEHCQRVNASAVEITNRTVYDNLKGLWQYVKDLQSGMWIGLERSIFGKNPEWKWISGSKVEYNEWNNSNPVNSLNYSCGKIILVNETNEIKWLDANCHDKLPFICKGLKEIPCYNNVTTLHAEICMDDDKHATPQFTWDECKECLNTPKVGHTSKFGTLCVDRCP